VRIVGGQHRHVADLLSVLHADEIDRPEQPAGVTDRLRQAGERPGDRRDERAAWR
jgi:hypothetical protein